MLSIKVSLLICAVAGVLISLGEMLGFFKDKDRISFFKTIKNNLECDKNLPGARKFIKHFVFRNPDFKGISQKEIEEAEKITFVGTFMADPENKRPVDGILSGNIKLKNSRGKANLNLCSFEDLKKWSQKSPFWQWLGWSIVAISVVLSIILLIIEQTAKG